MLLHYINLLLPSFVFLFVEQDGVVAASSYCCLPSFVPFVSSIVSSISALFLLAFSLLTHADST